tara:strand:+ start:1 stop:1158 length:1158 start_codon:yes stop_codon:yes gene_type:complete
MKSIGILGSTGSIGTQSLDVISKLDEEIHIKYLTCNNNFELLAEQAKLFKPELICIVNKKYEKKLANLINSKSIRVVSGMDGLLNLCKITNLSLVINGLVGTIGMLPTIEVITAGVNVALANKESLVMAGKQINELLKKKNVKLFPVDSEHNAIWQCLKGEKYEQINKIILTASGGPFRKMPKSQFKEIVKKDALKHPNWNMGNKITIDSATMMNKGLEVIEAYWLFNVQPEQIEIVVHPQSIIHSMVEFTDGSVKAQLGTPDMKIPIQYAITYPDHGNTYWGKLDLTSIGQLSFEKPDFEKFPCIKLAYKALKNGGSYPAALNIANDEAVYAFLNDKINFYQIPIFIEDVLNNHNFIPNPNLKQLLSLKVWIGKYIRSKIQSLI